MARFQTTLDIWALDDDARAKLQPGQWVRAGSAFGRFLGQRRSSTVVAWSHNGKGRGLDYIRALRSYAKGNLA